MKNKVARRDNRNEKRDCFCSELDNLLQASCNAIGIPEPSLLNQFEDAGKYTVYLSKLTKCSDDK